MMWRNKSNDEDTPIANEKPNNQQPLRNDTEMAIRKKHQIERHQEIIPTDDGQQRVNDNHAPTGEERTESSCQNAAINAKEPR